jgi:hypothetical protein
VVEGGSPFKKKNNYKIKLAVPCRGQGSRAGGRAEQYFSFSIIFLILFA